jgi:hypothetical protein
MTVGLRQRSWYRRLQCSNIGAGAGAEISTKDEGFLYQELDVTHANGGSICGEAYRYPDRDPNRDLSTLST